MVSDRAVIEAGDFYFFFPCSFRGSVARRSSSGNKSRFILWDGTWGGKGKRGRAAVTRGWWGLAAVSGQAGWEVRTGIPWLLKGDEGK